MPCKPSRSRFGARPRRTGEQPCLHVTVLPREGRTRQAALERLLEVNEQQCRPPLSVERVRKQLDGAVTYSRRNPSVEEPLRARARQVLDDRRAGKTRVEPRGKRERSGLVLPFADVRLSGPPRWLWRGKVP
jgi:hypothetical protein